VAGRSNQGTGAGGGPVASSGTRDTSQAAPVDEGPFTLAAPDRGGLVDLDPGSITFAGFEWAVPALILSVPGLFLLLAVAVESFIGLAWLPIARRWVGEDDRSRRRRLRRRISAT